MCDNYEALALLDKLLVVSCADLFDFTSLIELRFKRKTRIGLVVYQPGKAGRQRGDDGQNGTEQMFFIKNILTKSVSSDFVEG